MVVIANSAHMLVSLQSQYPDSCVWLSIKINVQRHTKVYKRFGIALDLRVSSKSNLIITRMKSILLFHPKQRTNSLFTLSLSIYRSFSQSDFLANKFNLISVIQLYYYASNMIPSIPWIRKMKETSLKWFKRWNSMENVDTLKLLAVMQQMQNTVFFFCLLIYAQIL